MDRRLTSALISPTWGLLALGARDPTLLLGKQTVSQGRHSHSGGNQIPVGPVMPPHPHQGLSAPAVLQEHHCF